MKGREMITTSEAAHVRMKELLKEFADNDERVELIQAPRPREIQRFAESRLRQSDRIPTLVDADLENILLSDALQGVKISSGNGKTGIPVKVTPSRRGIEKYIPYENTEYGLREYIPDAEIDNAPPIEPYIKSADKLVSGILEAERKVMDSLFDPPSWTLQILDISVGVENGIFGIPILNPGRFLCRCYRAPRLECCVFECSTYSWFLKR